MMAKKKENSEEIVEKKETEIKEVDSVPEVDKKESDVVSKTDESEEVVSEPVKETEAVSEPQEEKTKTTKKKNLEEPTVNLDEFNELRKDVKNVGQKKEWLFEVRSTISKEIKGLFSVLKNLKSSRDQLTLSVQDLKKEREDINIEIKDLISKIKEIQKTSKKDNDSINVPKLKKELEKLQYFIETNPMSPEEEKKIMRQVKEREKLISKAKDQGESEFESGDISKKINQLKERSNVIHDQVQKNAVESQEKHEEMISVSKSIKFLKAREKEIHQLFTDIKEDYKVKRRLFMQNRKFYASSKKKPSKAISQKDMIKKVEENIEDKIKKGQKITTEDLLSFRG